MEVYANILQSKFEDRKIGYHPKCLMPKITHLAFADDLMVFFDGNSQSLAEINHSLEMFHALSGLAINREKSYYYTGGITAVEEELFQLHGYVKGQLPVRYLGLPLMHRKLRVAEYSPLIDKIKRKLTTWTTKVLSFAGRLVLLKSVIYSLLNFWMGAFTLPKTCLKNITGLCNDFLWGGKDGKRGIPKVGWAQICLPKAEGGLGLRDFTKWNKVLQLKLIWLLFTSKDSLWVAWTKQHHLLHRHNHENFWSIESKNTDTWQWKSILHHRNLAKKFMRCKIGNGKEASFWYDSWMTTGPLIETIGDYAPQRLRIPRTATVSFMTEPTTTIWRFPSASTRSREGAELRRILSSVQPPRQTDESDIYHWEADAVCQGKISTFNSAKTWDNLRHKEAVKPWVSAVWFKGAVPKHAFTFWVANLNRLPIRSRLASWGLLQIDTCCVCGAATETRDHLFLSCELATTLWIQLLHRLGERSTFHNWESIILWLTAPDNKRVTLLRKICVQALVFLIWKERNNRLHTSISTSSECVFKKYDRIIKDILLLRRKKKGYSPLLSLWFTYS